MQSQFGSMGMQYEDKREDIVDQHLVVMLARLTISLTIVNRVRQAQAVDQFPK